ncbi:oligosaccharide repeat unit polymerase [Clostridium perfringens]|nr:oligosaccharide repeat unit polymerase [Clostridium perfringens]
MLYYREKRELNILKKINFYLTIILMCFIITPYLNRNLKKEFYLILITWSLSAFMVILLNRFKIKYKKILIIISLWCLWFVFLRVIGYSSAAWGNYINSLIFYFLFFIMAFLETYLDKEKIKKLIKYILIFITINLIDNIYLNFKFINANTLIFTDYGKNYLKTNVGTTNFSAMIFLFSGILMILFLNKKDKLNKLIYLIGIILSCFLVFYQHGRATATIISIFLLLSLIFEKLYYNNKNNKKIFLQISICIFIILVIIPSMKLIINIIGNDRIIERFNSIINFLSGKGAVGISGGDSFDTRTYLILISIKTFFLNIKNFIIGTGYNLIKTYSMSEMIAKTGVGYHSELTDVLGTYGIIGGISIFLILKYMWDILKKKSKVNIINLQVRTIYVAFIIFSIFNLSFSSDIGIIVIIVLPNIHLIIEEKK